MKKKCCVYDSPKKGKILKAFSFIKKKELILNLLIDSKIIKRDRYTIETNFGNVIHSMGMYINNSCDPNSAVDKNKGILFAIKDIQINEEITFSYKDNESKITEPFNCLCNECVRKNSSKYIS